MESQREPGQVETGMSKWKMKITSKLQFEQAKMRSVETDGFPPLRERICEAESFKYVVTRWLETSGARPYYRTASFLLYRKLLSCKVKNAPQGCTLRRIR